MNTNRVGCLAVLRVSLWHGVKRATATEVLRYTPTTVKTTSMDALFTVIGCFSVMEIHPQQRFSVIHLGEYRRLHKHNDWRLEV